MTILISASFTKDSGDVATGLALADVALYLTQVDKTTGAATIVWDGTQHPTVEVDNIGAYLRAYASDDLDAYDYHAAAHYSGATVLDAAWVTGVLSSEALRTADVIFQRDIDQVEDDAAKHSLATAVLKSVSRTRDDHLGHILTYQTDGVTVQLTQDVSTSTDDEPIDELGVGA